MDIKIPTNLVKQLPHKAKALGCFDVVLKSFRIDNFLMMAEKALKKPRR